MSNHSFQTASDIIRDGLGVELIDENYKVLAEVFRCDADHSIKFSACEKNLPLADIINLIAFAKQRLDPFEDGTPIKEFSEKTFGA